MTGKPVSAHLGKPYVGPTPIQAGQPFYGRESETGELVDRLLARRIVLLHSPSGAGKTSLIQAGLLPALREQDFITFPPLLVSRSPQSGQIPESQPYNPYLLSVLMLLDESLPEESQTPLSRLANMSLLDYLNGWIENKDRFAKIARDDKSPDNSSPDNYFLIFDQFEEILTLHPDDQTNKIAFFSELMPVLYDYHYWVLFALREDYLAELEPYLSYFPDRLSARYRLEFLGPHTALEAIQKPARDFRVEFQDEAAGRLVDDLRQVSSMSHEGEITKEPGPFIEPVQLQVVCSNLWEAPRPDPNQISLADVEKFGNVDNALANYYAVRVKEGALLSSAPERNLRQWIGGKLITPNGLRSQVLSAPDPEYALTETAIRCLVDAYLVREEQRRGAVWLELAHDRLAEPIRQDNDAWFEQHLSLLQRQAPLWLQEGAPDDLLLRGEALRDAQDWAQAHPGELNDLESKFLLASQHATEMEAKRLQEQAERLETQQREATRFRRLFAVAVVVAILALVLAGLAGFFGSQASQQRATAQAANIQAIANAGTAMANEANAKLQGLRADAQKSTAEVAREASRIGELAALSIAQEDKSLASALLLGVEAFRAKDNYRNRDVLLRNLQYSPHLEQILDANSAGVSSIAFSPDGKLLASGGYNGAVVLWDVASRRQLDSGLQAPTAINCIAFSPQGDILASGGMDGTVILWDMTTYKQLKPPLHGHTAEVTSVAFSPDGKSLASGSNDGYVILWSLAGREPFSRYRPKENQPIKSLAFSPDGNTIAIGLFIKRIILWDIASQEPLGQPLWLSKGSVLSLVFSPNGKILASSGSDNDEIVLWDVEKQTQLGSSLSGHTSGVNSIAFSPDGMTLASGSWDHTIILWDVASQKQLGQPLKGHSDIVTSVAFNLDGHTIASGGYDGAVILWDVASRLPLDQRMKGSTYSVSSMAFSPDGTTLASGSDGGEVILWDVASRQPLSSPLQGNYRIVLSVAFSPDGRTLSSVEEDGMITLWDVAGRQMLGEPIQGLSGRVSRAAFSPDGKTLVLGNDEGAIIFWDLTSRHALSPPRKVHVSRITSIAFNSDGTMLASSSEDGTTILWDVARQQTLGSPLIGTLIYCLAFSHDGRILASSGYTWRITLWDVATHIALGQDLSGHTGFISSLAFSPDGKILASASYDNSIILWDVVSRRLLGQPLRGHTDWIRFVAFSPDGKTLASGGNDNFIILWDVDPASWAQRACQIAGRNFTQAEWQEYFPGEPYRLTCPQWPAGE
jgi:WD40 repeat protein